MVEPKQIPEQYDYFPTQAKYLTKIMGEMCLDLELAYPELGLDKLLWESIMEDIIVGYIEMVQDDFKNGLIPEEWGKF